MSVSARSMELSDGEVLCSLYAGIELQTVAWNFRFSFAGAPHERV